MRDDDVRAQPTAGVAIPVTRRRLFTAFAITAGFLTGCREQPVPFASPAQLDQYRGNAPEPLAIGIPQLNSWRSASDQNLLLLDLSSLRRYRSGHIPGAVHAWWQETNERDAAIYGTVLKPDNTTNQADRLRVLRRMGITESTRVVAYDDAQNRWAARVVWFLRFLGFDRSCLLDGGLAAWNGVHRTVETRTNRAPDADPGPITPRQGFYVDTDDLVLLLEEPTTILLDVRTASEYEDTVAGTLPLGRIPGSLSFPWTATIRDEFGRLRPQGEIDELLRRQSVTSDHQVIIYGRFGCDAAHAWVVLSLLGYENVQIYDEGWAGWASSPELPTDPLITSS